MTRAADVLGSIEDVAALRACVVFVAVLSTATSLGAQRATGSVRGVVVDARTGQALAGARITLSGAPVPVATNDAGRFLAADLPAGSTRIEVSLVGYALARRDVNVPAGGTLELTLPLSEGTGTYTEQVQVAGDLFMRAAPGVPGQMVIGSAELQNLRSLIADDPMRAVQALPGVGGSDDFRSDFSVRASSFRHVGVTLDGVPSRLLVHTVHAADNAGSLAMINSDILDGVTLMAGSYPQRFGDRTGAEVNFRTREGSRERPQVRLSVSAIAASLVAEGPLGRGHRGSWLVSGRKSYIGWLVRAIDPDTTGTFGFIDAQAKVVYDLTPRHTAQVNVVAGRSRYDEHAIDPGPRSLEVGFNRSVLAGFTLRSSLGPALVATQRVYTVLNRFGNHNDTSLPLERGSEDDLSYRGDVVLAGPASTIVEAGVHAQRVHGAGEVSSYDDQGRLWSRERFARTRGRVGGYLLARLRPWRALTVSPGARVDRWDLTGETKASPWMQIELALPRGLLAAAGTGIHRQSPDVIDVDGPQGALDPRTERARHVDAGVGQQVGAWRWQATAFARTEDDVLWLPNSEPRLENGVVVFPDPQARYEHALDGSAKGAELLLQRKSANGFSGWVGYSWVNARYDDRTRGAWFAADAEQRHTLNVYAHYRLTSRTSVGGRFRAATNTPLVGYLAEAGDGYVLTDRRNGTRLPFYSRLDLRTNRTFDLAGGRLTLFIEIVNAYNRRNLRGREDLSVNRRTGLVRNATEKLFPIVPSAGFLLEF